MKLIDISMTLNHQTPAWPGDEAFHFQLTWSMKETGSVNVGQFQASSHTGTHVDAPFHYDNNGLKLAEIPPERFIGDALVIHIEGEEIIRAKHLQNFNYTGVTKLLIGSKSWKDRTQFPDNYAVIAEDVGPFLKENGIDLIGVDTPSVDPETSQEIKSHHSLYKHDILILEGLQLDHVDPGRYELMAFPLKMEEADGSPVRALLRKQ